MTTIEHYYRKYGPMVFKRCMEILKNEDSAVDAMQDVFAGLLKLSVPEIRNIKFPSTYLYRMATNVCLNIIRAGKKDLSTDPAELVNEIAASEDHESRFFLREKITRLFGGEKKSTRVIAYMRYIDKMGLQEIADEMEMSVSGIKKRLRNIRDKYRKMEAEDGI